MYTYVLESFWPRIYFVTFWIFSVLIMLNIAVAFVLDIYHSVSDDIKKEYKRRQYVVEIKSKFNNVPTLEYNE